jgi:hypothetical protein
MASVTKISNINDFNQYITNPAATNYKMVYVMSRNCDGFNLDRFLDCVQDMVTIYDVYYSIYEDTKSIWETYIQQGIFYSGSVVLIFDGSGALTSIENDSTPCDCLRGDQIIYTSYDERGVIDSSDAPALMDAFGGGLTPVIVLSDVYIHSGYGIMEFTDQNNVPFPIQKIDNYQGNTVFEQNTLSIRIPCSCQIIGNYALSGLGIYRIYMNNSLLYIGNYAFSDDKKLTNVVIPDSVKELGDGVFSKCEVLNDVVIGKGVSHIGADIFEGAGTTSGYIIVHVKAQVPPSVTSFSRETYTIAEVIVPQGTLSTYQNDPMWGGFANIHE